MNERIKELAEQAITDKRTLDEFIAELKLNPNEYYGFKISELEKFAELIVKECARVAINADLEDVDGSDSHVLQAASEQIKQHFGVE